MRKYPPKWETLNDAFVGIKKNPVTKRDCKHFKCNKCKEDFPSSFVQVDHKNPVVDPKVGFVNWDTFIDRLLCDKKNLQVLCKDCHDKKTKKEKQERIKCK